MRAARGWGPRTDHSLHNETLVISQFDPVLTFTLEGVATRRIMPRLELLSRKEFSLGITFLRRAEEVEIGRGDGYGTSESNPFFWDSSGSS